MLCEDDLIDKEIPRKQEFKKFHDQRISEKLKLVVFWD